MKRDLENKQKIKLANNLFKCRECLFKTHVESSLLQHMKSIHEISTSQLFILRCEYQCTRISRLGNHKRKNANLLKCSKCDYRTHSKNSLRLHKKFEHENLRSNSHYFSCLECDYRCARKGNLKIHRRKHRNERFKCSHCNFRTHSKENPVVKLWVRNRKET